MTSKSKLELIEELEYSGLLADLYLKGIIPCKFKFHYEIYLAVDKDMKINKSSRTVAVEEVARRLKISTKTVWKALQDIQN